jgi:hypothetical protein
MPYSSPKTLSHKEFSVILAKLKVLLDNLPVQLPLKNPAESQYASLISFVLDPDILEKTGDEIATLGEQLEQVFGWRSRTTVDGIIPIIERGDALCALHPLLETFYIKYPGNNVLKKWVIDVVTRAEKIYLTYGCEVRS